MFLHTKHLASQSISEN